MFKYYYNWKYCVIIIKCVVRRVIIRIFFFFLFREGRRSRSLVARRRRRLVWINMGGRVGNKCQVGLTVLPRNITRFTNANFGPWRRVLLFRWIIVSRMARLFVIILEHFPFFRVSFFCHCTRATVKSVGIFRNNEPSDEPSRSDVFPIPQFFDYSLLAKTNRQTFSYSLKYDK